MCISFEEEPVVADVVRASETRVEVPEAEMDLFEDVGALGLLVDLHVLALERVFDGEDRFQVLVVDLDQRQCLKRSVLVDRRDSGDRLADVADLVDGERGLVLGRGHDPHLLGHVRADHCGHDPGVGERSRDVDTADACVRPRRPQESPVEHPRQKDVVGIARFAREMCPRIHLRQTPANDGELAHERAAAFSMAS